MSEKALDRSLQELAAAGLLTFGEFEDGAPHLNVHRLVQDIMRARLAGKGRAEELAALSTRAVECTFDDTETFAGRTRNLRWLPQAIGVLEHASKEGELAWHTLWTCNFIGDLHVERGYLARALSVYHVSLAISDRLAKADSGNAGWQRDLSVSHTKIGDVLRAQGNLPAALEAYTASQAIVDRLAKADPGNAGWQRDLSVSHTNIGDVLRAQGNFPAALEAYTASLAIAT